MRAFIGAELVKRIQPGSEPYEVRDTRLQGFLLRVQPSGIMTYYIQYARGKRLRLARVGTVKPEAARRRAEAILHAVFNGEDPMEEKRKAKAHTLSTFVDEVYAPWAAGTLRSANETVRSLKRNFPDLQNKKLHEINPWLVEKWRSGLLKAGQRPSSVNRALDNLKAALNRATEWGHLKENPLVRVKRTKDDRAAPVRYLSSVEEKALLAALIAREEGLRTERDSANAWRKARGYPLFPDLRAAPFVDSLRPIVLLSLNTGLRRGEVFSLTWADIDLDQAVLTVRGVNAKSGATRHVPLNAPAQDVLTELHKARPDGGASENLIFPGREGKRLDNLRRSWQTALTAANIKNFRWHDMRHSFASRLVMAGVDLNTVRELLGHTTITMTLRYAHLAPEHKAAAVAKLAAMP